MRSVLAFDDIDMKHHSGIISEFRRLYIKTNVLIQSSHLLSLCFLTFVQIVIMMISL